ncbi:IclR family transcriptional regulator [Variovorax robiniae]|uniref:IclR family transcriptional regulator n=1 Tax=Variovorax robiniae TaxID=1836199 RepID=A0ABU8XG21_9BURK
MLDLLELLARRGQDMSHTDIGEALDIPKSSLTQLLRNLTARGYLDYSAISRGYRLGEAVAKLAGKANQGRSILSIVEPILSDITAAINESSAFNQLRGFESEVVATVSSSQRLVSHMRKGDLAPLYATSGGKALLAFMPEEDQERYLETVKFEPITSNTIRSVKELRRQLKAVRETGVASVNEEFTPGIVGLAMPILSSGGTALGALNVAVPAVRFNDVARERILKALNDALVRINRSLSERVGA